MVAGAFNGGGGGQWQQRHRRHNNQIKEEAAFGRPPTLSDAQSIGGRRLRDVGNGASAGLWGCSVGIVGRRQQRIVIGRASAAPSHTLAAALVVAHQRNYGGGVVGAMGGGSISVGRWWR